MKFIVQKLQFGEIIEARVTEILSEQEVIMSFKGDLLQVQNHSRQKLSVGESIYCRVTSTSPLRFEIAHIHEASAFKLDRFV